MHLTSHVQRSPVEARDPNLFAPEGLFSTSSEECVERPKGKRNLSWRVVQWTHIYYLYKFMWDHVILFNSKAICGLWLRHWCCRGPCSFWTPQGAMLSLAGSSATSVLCSIDDFWSTCLTLIRRASDHVNIQALTFIHVPAFPDSWDRCCILCAACVLLMWLGVDRTALGGMIFCWSCSDRLPLLDLAYVLNGCVWGWKDCGKGVEAWRPFETNANGVAGTSVTSEDVWRLLHKPSPNGTAT